MRGRLLIALVATVVATTASPALAAPEGLAMLSSWAPVTVGQSVVGGDQTIVVVNHGAETAPNQVLDLEPRPCRCDRSEVTIDGGTIAGGAWLIPALEPGESASLTIRYVRASESGAESSPESMETQAGSTVRAAAVQAPVQRSRHLAL